MKCFATILVFCFTAQQYALGQPESRRSLHELFKRGWCRELDESCWGFPRCCGDTQCYYEGDITTGRCIECVSQGLRCQFDSNCCQGLQCDKGGDMDINGECQPPRANDEQCWEDSQCASGFCDDVIIGPGSGICKSRSSP